ncbi:hypothetical protein BGZ59_006189 [Podila verticillata]|nr:hypothetical protein BGZ59_006189 [Podila verticillata]
MMDASRSQSVCLSWITSPKLEHLQMGAYRKLTIHTAIQELTGSDGVRSHTLEKLTFFKVIKYRNNIGPPMSMFRQCPQVERMHLNVIIAAGSSDIFETDQEPNFDIHKTVLAWKSRSHGASLDTADDTAVTTDAKVETSTDNTEMPQNTYEDLKKFGRPLGDLFHAYFQHGCRDLVTLWAWVGFGTQRW